MGLTVEDYGQALLGLMPTGPAWPKDEGSPAFLLLAGLAQELFRVDGREDTLLNEADPRTAIELLPDWERITGLSANASLNTALRQLAVTTKLTSRGGQTPAYFIAVGAALGYEITITEFDEWSFDSDDDAPWYGEDWNFAWQVNIPLALGASIDWTFDSDDDTPFAIYADQLSLKSFLNDKPAHTVVLFAYQ